MPNSMMSWVLRGCAPKDARAYCLRLVNFFLFGPARRVAGEDFMRLAAVWPSGMPNRVLLHWWAGAPGGLARARARARGGRAGVLGAAARGAAP
jgi:hypothetical protein